MLEKRSHWNNLGVRRGSWGKILRGVLAGLSGGITECKLVRLTGFCDHLLSAESTLAVRPSAAVVLANGIGFRCSLETVAAKNIGNFGSCLVLNAHIRFSILKLQYFILTGTVGVMRRP